MTKPVPVSARLPAEVERDRLRAEADDHKRRVEATARLIRERIEEKVDHLEYARAAVQTHVVRHRWLLLSSSFVFGWVFARGRRRRPEAKAGAPSTLGWVAGQAATAAATAVVDRLWDQLSSVPESEPSVTRRAGEDVPDGERAERSSAPESVARDRRPDVLPRDRGAADGLDR